MPHRESLFCGPGLFFAPSFVSRLLLGTSFVAKQITSYIQPRRLHMLIRMFAAGNLLTLVLLLTTSCGRAVEKVVETSAPRVTSINLALTDLSLQDFTLTTKLTFENANRTVALIKDLHFNVLYFGGSGWENLAEGSLASTEIKPESSLEMDVPIVGKNLSVLGALVKFIQDQGRISLRLDGSATAAVGRITFDLPLKQEFTLSVSLPPLPPPPPLPPALPPPLLPQLPSLPFAATPRPTLVPVRLPTPTPVARLIDITIKISSLFPPPGTYQFEPNVITLKAGQPYIIRFSSTHPAPHTLTADRLGIDLVAPPPGLSVTSDGFIETQPGEYRCYDKISSATCTIRVER